MNIKNLIGLMSASAALGFSEVARPVHAADITQQIGNIQRSLGLSTPTRNASRDRGFYSLDASAPTSPWYFMVAVKTNHNSNITYAPSGEIDAGRIVPFGELGYENQFGEINVSSTLDLGVERYTEARENNFGWLSAAFSAQVSGGDREPWIIPFVSYEPFFLRSAGFGAKLGATHDFSFGGKKTFCFEDAAGSCGDPNGLKTTLQFVGKGLIRVSDPKDANEKRVALEVNFKHAMTSVLGLSISQTLSASWFGSGVNSGRHDWTSNTALSLSYRLAPKALLVAGANFTHNHSNIAANQFNQWEVGPTIQVTWEF